MTAGAKVGWGIGGAIALLLALLGARKWALRDETSTTPGSTVIPPRESSVERAQRLKRLSDKTGLDPAVLAAIEKVESGGNPAAIRFEPHIFLGVGSWGSKSWARPDLAGQIPYTPKGAGKPWSTKKSETDLGAFNRARDLDPLAAVSASSWGRYQVLGWALLPEVPGNPSAAAARFFTFPHEVSDNLLVRWLEENPAAKTAAARKDWREFASRYNGAGNVDVYAPRLTAAYTEATQDPLLA